MAAKNFIFIFVKKMFSIVARLFFYSCEIFFIVAKKIFVFIVAKKLFFIVVKKFFL